MLTDDPNSWIQLPVCINEVSDRVGVGAPFCLVDDILDLGDTVTIKKNTVSLSRVRTKTLNRKNLDSFTKFRVYLALGLIFLMVKWVK